MEEKRNRLTMAMQKPPKDAVKKESNQNKPKLPNPEKSDQPPLSRNTMGLGFMQNLTSHFKKQVFKFDDEKEEDEARISMCSSVNPAAN